MPDGLLHLIEGVDKVRKRSFEHTTEKYRLPGRQNHNHATLGMHGLSNYPMGAAAKAQILLDNPDDLREVRLLHIWEAVFSEWVDEMPFCEAVDDLCNSADPARTTVPLIELVKKAPRLETVHIDIVPLGISLQKHGSRQTRLAEALLAALDMYHPKAKLIVTGWRRADAHLVSLDAAIVSYSWDSDERDNDNFVSEVVRNEVLCTFCGTEHKASLKSLEVREAHIDADLIQGWSQFTQLDHLRALTVWGDHSSLDPSCLGDLAATMPSLVDLRLDLQITNKYLDDFAREFTTYLASLSPLQTLAISPFLCLSQLWSVLSVHGETLTSPHFGGNAMWAGETYASTEYLSIIDSLCPNLHSLSGAYCSEEPVTPSAIRKGSFRSLVELSKIASRLDCVQLRVPVYIPRLRPDLDQDFSIWMRSLNIAERVTEWEDDGQEDLPSGMTGQMSSRSQDIVQKYMMTLANGNGRD
ncbi:MAG: hypothetical protein Q9160_001429 [Pyrenula sp. 1 TL-2023]